MDKKREVRKHVTGLVIGDKMEKTITVRAEGKVRHHLYGKYVNRRVKYYAHDEKNEAGVGDTVEIAETRPISKLKSWRLVRVLSRAHGGSTEVAGSGVAGDT
jgi:small subunit ribosomal protein S17